MRIKISDWLEGRKDSVVELARSPVTTQLKAYDEAGTGLGFVMIGVLVSDVIKEQEETQISVQSVPVIKIKGEWHTVEDENLQEIASGFIRMVAPEG